MSCSVACSYSVEMEERSYVKGHGRAKYLIVLVSSPFL